MARKRIPERFQVWIEARQRFHLSHAQVQMARELGMNPKSLGKLDNHRHEPWKLPLPQFIEQQYFSRFGKERPDVVVTPEERARLEVAKKAAHRAAKRGSDFAAAAAEVSVGFQQPAGLATDPIHE
jgi:hypothetical protein